MANPLVLIGLGVYLAVMLGVGLYAGRRVHSSTDFIVAGQRLPLLLCTGTLAATWFGGGIYPHWCCKCCIQGRRPRGHCRPFWRGFVSVYRRPLLRADDAAHGLDDDRILF